MAKRLVIAALLVLAAVAGAGGFGVLVGGRPAGDGSRAATVTRVVDGDTVVLSGIGKSRLIGIDTPEVYGGVECYGPEASAYTKHVLSGRRVRYRIGAEPRDRYGRALVYLWLDDGRFFNEMLASGGYARTLTIAPNTRYADRFRSRADQARDAGRGLWSPEACA
jgi:micrococcal nuclease